MSTGAAGAVRGRQGVAGKSGKNQVGGRVAYVNINIRGRKGERLTHRHR